MNLHYGDDLCPRHLFWNDVHAMIFRFCFALYPRRHSPGYGYDVVASVNESGTVNGTAAVDHISVGVEEVTPTDHDSNDNLVLVHDLSRRKNIKEGWFVLQLSLKNKVKPTTNSRCYFSINVNDQEEEDRK